MRRSLGMVWDPQAEEAISVDEYRDGQTQVIRAELPGIDPDKEVELTVSEGMLRINAERRIEKDTEDKGYTRHELRYGRFTRHAALAGGRHPLGHRSHLQGRHPRDSGTGAPAADSRRTDEDRLQQELTVLLPARRRPGREARYSNAGRNRMAGRRWSDLTTKQQTAVLVLGSVQLSLAATAWADLATRPAASVNGSKTGWALIIAINFVGPLAYFRWGRRPVT